jgi:hypothetical protein
MTHDPYQTLAMSGAFPGVTSQFGLPYPTLQNPYAQQGLFGQQLGQPFGQQGYSGIPGIGAIHPHQLQLASLLGGQGGFSYLQNPWLTSILQNPQLAQQSPYQQFGQPGQFGQQNPQLAQQSPYQQFGQQGQYGQQFPQNPLLQAILAQQQMQNPLLQSILAQQQQQSPFQQYGQFVGQGLHNPLLGAILAQQQQSPYQQVGLGFGQGQLGPQLAPQTWIGPSPYLNPLAQLGGRGIQGVNPQNPWIGM